MTQSYKTFTSHSTVENRNAYFQECIENETVNVIVVEKQNYASVEWDLITLNSAQRKIKDEKCCSLAEELRDYYESYIFKKKFKRTDNSYVIHNMNGIFYIYKDDIEKVLLDVCKMIDNSVKSGCIEYMTMDDFAADIPEELRKYMSN